MQVECSGYFGDLNFGQLCAVLDVQTTAWGIESLDCSLRTKPPADRNLELDPGPSCFPPDLLQPHVLALMPQSSSAFRGAPIVGHEFIHLAFSYRGNWKPLYCLVLVFLAIKPFSPARAVFSAR